MDCKITLTRGREGVLSFSSRALYHPLVFFVILLFVFFPKGFPGDFREGLRTSLGRTVELVDSASAADMTMKVTVRHFYGEYFRSFEAALLEFGSGLLLFLPRLVTDAIPYNAFAGRAALFIS
jgi:hypothetical protein